LVNAEGCDCPQQWDSVRHGSVALALARVTRQNRMSPASPTSSTLEGRYASLEVHRWQLLCKSRHLLYSITKKAKAFSSPEFPSMALPQGPKSAVHSLVLVESVRAMALPEHFSKMTGTHRLRRPPSSLNSIPHPRLIRPRSGQTRHDVGLSSTVIRQLPSRY
jgi:hypothetical protein